MLYLGSLQRSKLFTIVYSSNPKKASAETAKTSTPPFKATIRSILKTASTTYKSKWLRELMDKLSMMKLIKTMKMISDALAESLYPFTNSLSKRSSGGTTAMFEVHTPSTIISATMSVTRTFISRLRSVRMARNFCTVSLNRATTSSISISAHWFSNRRRSNSKQKHLDCPNMIAEIMITVRISSGLRLSRDSWTITL